MKKTLIALTLAAVMPLAAYAAMDGHGKHSRGDRLERMAETLNLDDAQKSRMEALFKEHQAERKALREQMRAQMGEILNAEQLAKMEQMREQRHEKRKERRARRHKRDCADDKAS